MDPVAPLPAAVPAPADAAVLKAAEQFEALMIGQMLRQMRQSLRELASEDSPLKDSVNDDMLGLADTLVADALAGRRAFGVADALLRQLLPARGEALKSGAPPVAPAR